MTTRLRKQAEREREQRTTETISVSDVDEAAGRPSQWNVEQVFSYISSLPGNERLSLQVNVLLYCVSGER